MKPAEQNLRDNQTQLDMDGVMVGVSRQALEETLDELEKLRGALTELANSHTIRNAPKLRLLVEQALS